MVRLTAPPGSCPAGMVVISTLLHKANYNNFKPETVLCSYIHTFSNLGDQNELRVGLGGLCSIFYPLCYSNMLKIVPIMPKIMPKICLLCSNYAHYFWKEQTCNYYTLYRKSKLKQDSSSSTIVVSCSHTLFRKSGCGHANIMESSM